MSCVCGLTPSRESGWCVGAVEGRRWSFSLSLEIFVATGPLAGFGSAVSVLRRVALFVWGHGFFAALESSACCFGSPAQHYVDHAIADSTPATYEEVRSIITRPLSWRRALSPENVNAYRLCHP